jgi:uncharacterized membrane protein YdjX (TVP38/TMEM64 family)
MKHIRWWSLVIGIAFTLLLMFLAAWAMGFDIEGAPPMPAKAGPLAAITGIALLIADVFLPIPSSLVMIAHGALFGTVIGTALSLIGSIASALVAFAVGRVSTRTVRRLITPTEHEYATSLLQKWGVTAVALTRPIPILAETVAILAGSSKLTWTQTAIAAGAGSIIPSVVYAWAGANARNANHAIIFGGVILATGVLWWIGSRRRGVKLPAHPERA